MVAPNNGLLADPRSSMVMNSPIAEKAASKFPGEAPLQHDLRAWLEEFVSLHNERFSAAFANIQPRFMVDFNPFPMDELPPLVIDSATGITLALKLRRDEKRAELEHANRQLALRGDYAYAEYNNALFSKLDAAMFESAPLLLAKLKANHPIRNCVGMFHGPAAYREIVAMQNAGNAFGSTTRFTTLCRHRSRQMTCIQMPGLHMSTSFVVTTSRTVNGP